MPECLVSSVELVLDDNDVLVEQKRLPGNVSVSDAVNLHLVAIWVQRGWLVVTQ